MEKKNPEKNFNMEDEIKKVQEEYVKEGQLEKGIVEVELAEDEEIEEVVKRKNDEELERLKSLKTIKKGDRVSYFMIDNDCIIKEVSFKFPSTRIIMGLSEYGISGDGRLFLDMTKAIEILEKNKLFVAKFDIDDFPQDELEGFGSFLISILRNPRKFIQELYK